MSLRNMNPVVLALFAALQTNDLLDLKARQACERLESTRSS